MSESELGRRRELTFLQAEGLADLPTQMSGHSVNMKTKIVIAQLLGNLDTPGSDSPIAEFFTDYLELYLDDMPASRMRRAEVIKGHLESTSDAGVLDIIQFLARSKLIGHSGFSILKTLCERELLPYRLIGNYGSIDDLPTLFPVASREQAHALVHDLTQISDSGSVGARKHLAASSAALSAGDFAGSIRESIHAVESTAKAISGDGSADLAKALRKLDGSKPLHPALKQALEKLYAWTSDEKGIRHALIDEDANATEAQAIFMLSACAAFSAWITRENAP